MLVQSTTLPNAKALKRPRPSCPCNCRLCILVCAPRFFHEPRGCRTGWELRDKDTVAVVRNDDAAEPAEVVVLQVNSDRGRIGVKPVPYEFRDGSDRLRLCLALQEIRLNFDGVIGHQNALPWSLRGVELAAGF